MTLWQDFSTHTGKLMHKRASYFPVYERHFSQFCNKSMTFLEIGVARGGSARLWSRYFGPMAKIVGVDIEEKFKFEHPGIFIRIGDQSDEKFLQHIIDEFGVPDVVLDDGSHQQEHIWKTFQFLYPRMPKNGVYMVEDLTTAYWEEYGGGVDEPSSFINRAKVFIDQLNADHSRGAVQPNFMTRQTLSISFYDAIVVFEKGDVYWKDVVKSGRKSLRDRIKG
jgi:hypothetical protein